MASGRAVATPQLPVTPLLRGKGAPVKKSAPLLSVSVQPSVPPRRRTAVVLLGADAGPPPSKQLAALPKPTRSTAAPVGQLPLSAVLFDTSATLPAVAAMAIVPVASGTGSAAVP